MAAHVVHQNNEMLPRPYPPGKHEVLSQYGHHIIMHNVSDIDIDIVGGPSSQIDDSEQYPLLHKPTPSGYASGYTGGSIPDPTLCVTPEKSPAKKAKSKLKSNVGAKIGLSNTSAFRAPSSGVKSSHKVTFSQDVEIHQLSPETDSNKSQSETDLLQKLSLNNDSSLQRTRDVLSEDPISIKPQQSLFAQTSENVDIIDVGDIDKNPWKTKPSKSKHANKYCDMLSDKMSSGQMFVNNERSVTGLDRPEFNSTLLMNKEIESVAASKLDIVGAVKTKLKVDDKLKNKITEKATNKLDIEMDEETFGDLLSVEVRPGDLRDRVELEKTLKAKPVVKQRSKIEESMDAPDIMEFFTPDFQYEPLGTNVSWPQHTDTLRTTQLTAAFDLYRHVRAWEKW